jgi:outer membrane lipoprotein-sorting protein
MRRKIVLLVILALQTVVLCAQQTANEKQARRIFNQAYNQVFGEQGATLHYDVNIIGIYKTSGTIWYKGKKQKFVDERVNTWNDGQTAYMAFRKKKEVHIHHANSDKKDKYSGKFKFNLDDFDYSIAEDDGMFLITLKQKKKAKGTIKIVKAWVTKKGYEPVRLRIKVSIIWTTVTISDFKAGGIDDGIFVFPRNQYKDWKFIDKRNEQLKRHIEYGRFFRLYRQQ